jgi:hypothetical protein
MSKNDITKQEQQLLIKFRIAKIMQPIALDIDKLLDDYTNQQRMDRINFSGGEGYIQHIPEVVERVQREFLDLCYEILGDKVYLGNVHRQGIIGRYLDDGIFSKHWYIFHCIDDNYKQWGQPYFTLHPDKGTQRCLNDIPTIKEKIRELKLNKINEPT